MRRAVIVAALIGTVAHIGAPAKAAEPVRLRGIVHGRDGRPVREGWVVAFPSDRRHWKNAVAEGGRLMFAYGNGTSQNCGCDHLLDGMALRAGQRISICDGAGDTHPFEVISIKET